jgi:hypothetical protein
MPRDELQGCFAAFSMTEFRHEGRRFPSSLLPRNQHHDAFSACVGLRRNSRARGIGCARGDHGSVAGTKSGTRSLLGDGSDPSPGPRRLAKTPAACHPLPKGEGYYSDFYPRVRPKIWVKINAGRRWFRARLDKNATRREHPLRAPRQAPCSSLPSRSTVPGREALRDRRGSK